MKTSLSRTATKLVVILALIMTVGTRSLASGGILPCAIRWDANYTNGPSDPGAFTAKDLAPPKFRGRAPLHTKVVSDSQLRWEPTQASMDQEIEFAAKANLCWAFLLSGRNGQIDFSHPMNRAFSWMKSSSKKAKVPITAMIGSDNFGTPSTYKSAIEAILGVIREPNYLKVGERPVLWIPFEQQNIDAYWGGELKNFANALDYLRMRSREVGLKEPYIVLLAAPEPAVATLRVDAISRYAIIPSFRDHESYEDFRHSVERFWDAELRKTQVDVVPTVMIGWDPRPRLEMKPPWQSTTVSDIEHYVLPPTDDEIFVACSNAASWVIRQPSRSPTGLVLIYSWNENDEAGTVLSPTLDDKSASHLHACGSAFK